MRAKNLARLTVVLLLVIGACRSVDPEVSAERTALGSLEEMHGMPAVAVIATTSVADDRKIDIEIRHDGQVIGGGIGEDGHGEVIDPSDPEFKVSAITTVQPYPTGAVFDVVVRYFDARDAVTATRTLTVRKTAN